MSKYTTEVRFICENAAGLRNSDGYASINAVLDLAAPKVFNFDFPIFDESYRNVLCKKILKHYYTREICEETVGLWKLRLDTRMNEVMPYFNQLYKSELLEFNPLYDFDYTRTSKRDNTSTGNDTTESSRSVAGDSKTDTTDTTEHSNTNDVTSENTSAGTSSTQANGTSATETAVSSSVTNSGTTKTTISGSGSTASSKYDLYSDTPQGSLENVDSEEYLTNARKVIGDERTSNSETNEGETSSTTEDESATTTNETTENAVSGTTSDTTNGSVHTEGGSTTERTGGSTTEYNNNDTFNSNMVKTAESTEDYLERVSGKQSGASYARLLKEYRSTFLNIDMQVIESLSDLFFGLW